MKKNFIYIFFLFIPFYLLDGQAVELDQILPFEKKILQEAAPYIAKNPLKAYELRLLIAREYNAYGFDQKALEHYEKALTYNVTVDRSEALISTVVLSLNNKPLGLKNIQRLKNSNEGKKKELQEWIAMMTSYFSGNTIVAKDERSLFYTWSHDNKVEELIKDKKFEEAFLLVGPVKMDQLNINTKIRYDLLSSSVLKKVPLKLWCEDTLVKYPTSLTWTMRVCRYLRDKRDNKKSTETIFTIKNQIEKESPERLSWLSIVETL